MAAHATLRASDADREAVAERLRRAAVEGRLDADELDERLGAALRARTYGELDGLLADLPSGGVAPRPRARVRTRSALSVAIPVVLTLLAVAALVTVIAVAAAGWMVWMVIWILVCTTRGCARSRRRSHPPRRRRSMTSPAAPAR